MANSNNPTRNKTHAAPQPDTHIPPAQHVWLAGLGAMAKAQEQGSKAIEALVNDGLAFQRKSQAEAQQRLQEATERLSHMATGFGQQATGRVDKLEHLFEDRVAKALHRLGMPSLLDIQMLSDRVAQLEAQMQAQLQAARPVKVAPEQPSVAPAKARAAPAKTAKPVATRKTVRAKPKTVSPPKNRPKAS